ncbi:MAG: HEAT repeat domain-containing protein [Candidatus Electryonea clarkiae]|nr:HEAT repeat domain-containing protein [Candidatus Electryonea clarkiae]MDP8286089.1 HEAT repeat domain-containing protein [Candidatus Electryonea clarkiae]
MRSKTVRRLTSGLLILSIISLFLSVVLSGCSKKEPRAQRIPITVYLKRLGSEREETVDRARTAIISMGKEAVPYILKDWKRKKTTMARRYELAKLFEGIGPDAADAVPVLIEALEILDEDMIGHAAAALGGIGPASAAAAPRMAALLRSSDYSTQVGLLKGLSGIGPAASDAIPLMLEAAIREKTRREAIIALGKMGPQVVEELKAWLEGDDAQEKLIAFEILSNAGEDAITALPYLTKALKDNNPRIRIAAVRAIGQAGPKAVGVLDNLVDVLNDHDHDVRMESISAIAAIGSDLVGDRMLKAINDPKPRVREGSIRVINRWSTVMDKAKPKLIARLGDSNVLVQLAATDALSAMGEKIVPTMINLLNSENVQKRFGAARVLGNLGKSAKSAIPHLNKASRDKDSLVREEANRALQKIR